VILSEVTRSSHVTTVSTAPASESTVTETHATAVVPLEPVTRLALQRPPAWPDIQVARDAEDEQAVEGVPSWTRDRGGARGRCQPRRSDPGPAGGTLPSQPGRSGLPQQAGRPAATDTRERRRGAAEWYAMPWRAQCRRRARVSRSLCPSLGTAFIRCKPYDRGVIPNIVLARRDRGEADHPQRCGSPPHRRFRRRAPPFRPLAAAGWRMPTAACSAARVRRLVHFWDERRQRGRWCPAAWPIASRGSGRREPRRRTVS